MCQSDLTGFLQVVGAGEGLGDRIAERQQPVVAQDHGVLVAHAGVGDDAFPLGFWGLRKDKHRRIALDMSQDALANQTEIAGGFNNSTGL